MKNKVGKPPKFKLGTEEVKISINIPTVLKQKNYNRNRHYL